MINSCLTDLYFFPSTAYFKTIIPYDELIIEASDNFVKQSYRNRAHILGPHGIETLNIPVQKAQSKQKYREVKIDYTANWERKNYQTLQTAYSSSPFFHDYYLFIEQIFQKKYNFLFDLNVSLLEFIMKVLQFEKRKILTKSFELTYNKEWSDYRELHSAKKKKPSDWGQNDMKMYNQLFGKEFVVNLSVLDLIFNKGPESIKYLR